MRVRTLLGITAAICLSIPLVVSGPALATAASPADDSTQPTIEPFPDGQTRLAGISRYETAVAVSQRYAPGVRAVFIATGADFPDALSASAAASLEGGPLLLTQPNSIPAAVREELQRLQPEQIYVVGGTGVVSASVEATLRTIAPTSRLAGSDRYLTGRAVIGATFDSADHAIIATGRLFPDALAAAGAAGARSAPVVLVDGAKTVVSQATLDMLDDLGVTSVSIVGETGAVSAGIQSHLERTGYTVVRLGGLSRYDTAALVNEAYFPPGSASTTFLATGLDFPDALAAGALAGRLAAPLHLTPRSCMHPPVADAIDALGAAAHVALGGPAVVSDAAAQNARCVYPVTNEPIDEFAGSDYTLASDVAAPYENQPPVNVNDGSITVDATGLRIYMRRDLPGTRADHPVAYAQYGISALIEYQRTGEQLWLDRAERHGERLIEMRVERAGAWWYPYTFPWTYYQRTLRAPWWSAMAQGQALSLFVHLAEATGEDRWDDAADKTWASFTQPHSSTEPWSTLVIDDHLYFEEYAGDQPPLLVLNGQIFAMFGLYDYWRHTGDPEVARYFDGGATTVLDRMMPLVRVESGVSYYCVQADYCQSPLWQNQNYHGIHSWQLDTLARITGDAEFTQWADVLRTDWVPPAALRRAVPSPVPDGEERAGTGAELDWIEP
ncbi:MAG TPA: cell wall-binding repeat-containing protein [Agromyces sp.]